MKTNRSSASSNPYVLNPDQYAVRRSLCFRLSARLAGRYWHDAMVQVDDFKNEGVVASSSWPFPGQPPGDGQAAHRFDHPEEGATGWANTTMMHSEAKHPNCAYKWLEHP